METVVWVRAECIKGVERFQNRKQNVSDEHRSGRPVSVVTETVKHQIEQRIHDYRRVTIDETAVEFNMSYCSVYSIVHDDLGYSRWVPRQWSDDHKHAWLIICQEHLDHNVMKETPFSIELWQGTSPGYTFMNQRGRDNRCGGSTRCLLPTKNFKTQASGGKVMLTIFWDVDGPIFVHFQEKGQTATSALYSDMLVNELKPAIRSKLRGLFS
jgi:hypothetical protein